MECFDAQVRVELPDGEILYNLREAEVVIESWRRYVFVSSPGAARAWARQRSSVATLTPTSRETASTAAPSGGKAARDAVPECLSVSCHSRLSAPPRSAVLNARQLV